MGGITGSLFEQPGFIQPALAQATLTYDAAAEILTPHNRLPWCLHYPKHNLTVNTSMEDWSVLF